VVLRACLVIYVHLAGLEGFRVVGGLVLVVYFAMDL
jgi:hypothetical protein